MEQKQLLQMVQDVFIAKIMEKNSWGKNEVIEVWKDSLLKVLLDKINPA